MEETLSTLFHNFFEKINFIYLKKTPIIYKIIIFIRIEPILTRILSFCSNIVHPVFIFSGKEKHCLKDINVLYFGEKNGFHYYSTKIFTNEYQSKKIGNFSIFQIRKIIKNFQGDIDLALIKTDSFFLDTLSKKTNFIIPEWVDMELDTSQNPSDIFKNFSNGTLKDIKMIKQYHYTYEITDDPIKLDFFYMRMFLPSILSKYKEETPKSYLNFIKLLMYIKNVKLLLVKKDDTYVSGGLMRIIKDVAVLPSMGVLDANTEYYKQYASSALFYFHIAYAIENHIKRIEYGNTRAFLNDGVFQYKKKWGMYVTKSKFKFDIIGLKLCKMTDGVLCFLKNNPFIYCDGTRFMIFYYFNKSDPASLYDIQQICKRYYCSGIQNFFIFSSRSFTPDVLNCKSFKVSLKYQFQPKVTPNKYLDIDGKVCAIHRIN